ncbi:MAG TPA: low specificity L-threonine aldolase [bacterium]|nr:low specificity L-threonine aldolase [bacterium]
MRRSFGSDNHAGVHPAVFDALRRVNDGDVHAYGHDAYTVDVARRVASFFGPQAETFFVFNGTAANVISIRTACHPHQGVICAETAHINTDECGAPEWNAGVKLLTVPTPDGKLTPALVERRLGGRGDEHRIQPRLVSISQTTEVGTCYTPAELETLSVFCHGHGLYLHIDGARLSNAAATLNSTLGEAAAGADLISFGGTKNGLMAGEAVIVTDPALATGMLFLRKQSMQLSSKMRYLAAQFEAFLTDDLWLANARHANAMAQLLSKGIVRFPDLELAWPTQANGVFVRMPAELVEPLQKEYFFYLWDETVPIARLMCHFNTTEKDVRGFLAVVERLSGARTVR